MIDGVCAITGGAGTLGKAIMTVARREQWPVKFIIYSRGELLQAQTRAKFPEADYVIGDIRDYDRLSAVLAGCNLVVHAGALKRLPDCERNVSECVMTNVIGSMNVMRACIARGVKRAIVIGTDKEVRASTAYGHSKGLATALFINAPDGVTTFTGVRYGNVVASRGSVIPIWREQHAQGQPLTLTAGDMTRFWMSPFDAVKLVEEASDAKHGQVIVGKIAALSISQMAQIVCPGAKTREIGLRGTEKKHEDLVHEDEEVYDCGDVFVVGSGGCTGLHYSSDMAPRLTADQFHSMLADAEQVE